MITVMKNNNSIEIFDKSNLKKQNDICFGSKFLKLKTWKNFFKINNINNGEKSYVIETATANDIIGLSVNNNKNNNKSNDTDHNENGSNQDKIIKKRTNKVKSSFSSKSKQNKDSKEFHGLSHQHHLNSDYSRRLRRYRRKIIVFYVNDHPNWFQPNDDSIFLNNDIKTLSWPQHRQESQKDLLLNCITDDHFNDNHDDGCQCQYGRCRWNIMKRMFKLILINVNDYLQQWNMNNNKNGNNIISSQNNACSSIISTIIRKLSENEKDKQDDEEEEEEEENNKYSATVKNHGVDGSVNFGFCIIISDQMTQLINDDIFNIGQYLNFILASSMTNNTNNANNNHNNVNQIKNNNDNNVFYDIDGQLVQEYMNNIITYALYDELNEINMFRIKYKLSNHCAFIPIITTKTKMNNIKNQNQYNYDNNNITDNNTNNNHHHHWFQILSNGIIRISDENLFIQYQKQQQKRKILRRQKIIIKNSRPTLPSSSSSSSPSSCQHQLNKNEVHNDIDYDYYGFCTNSMRINNNNNDYNNKIPFNNNNISSDNIQEVWHQGDIDNNNNNNDECCLFRIFPKVIKEPNEQILVLLDHQINSSSYRYHNNHLVDVLFNGQSTINWLQMEWINTENGTGDSRMFLIKIPEVFLKSSTTILEMTIILDCNHVLGTRQIKYKPIDNGEQSDELKNLLFSIQSLNSNELFCQSFLMNSIQELDKYLAQIFNESLPDFGIFQYLSQPFNINLWLPTWLHFAAAHGMRSLLEKLLNCPASIPAIMIRNSSGLNAIDLARKYHHEDLVEILDKHLGQIYGIKQDLELMMTNDIQSNVIFNQLNNDQYKNNENVNRKTKPDSITIKGNHCVDLRRTSNYDADQTISKWNQKILDSKYELLLLIEQFKKGISIEQFRTLFNQWETIYHDVLQGQLSNEFLHSFNEIKKLCSYQQQPIIKELIYDDNVDFGIINANDDNGYSEPPPPKPFFGSHQKLLRDSHLKQLQPTTLPMKFEVDLV